MEEILEIEVAAQLQHQLNGREALNSYFRCQLLGTPGILMMWGSFCKRLQEHIWMLTGWRMMMEDAHTPASYIIAVVAVLSGAFLMPPFPLFFLIVGPVCLLGLVAVLFVRAKRSVQTEHKSLTSTHFIPMSHLR